MIVVLPGVGWNVPRRRDDEGARLDRPCSARCDRAAQSSSDTSSAAMIRLIVESRAAPHVAASRSSRRREEDAPVERRRRRFRRRRIRRIPQAAGWQRLRREIFDGDRRVSRRARPTRDRGAPCRRSWRWRASARARADAHPKMSLTFSNRPRSSAARRRLELLRRQRFGELLEELALLARELARRDRLHRDEQIAAAASRHVRHALAANAEHRTGRRAFRNLQRFGALADQWAPGSRRRAPAW